MTHVTVDNALNKRSLLNSLEVARGVWNEKHDGYHMVHDAFARIIKSVESGVFDLGAELLPVETDLLERIEDLETRIEEATEELDKFRAPAYVGTRAMELAENARWILQGGSDGADD